MSTLLNKFLFYLCLTTETDLEGTCLWTKFTVVRIVTFFFTTRCGLVITDASEGEDNRVFTAWRLSDSLLNNKPVVILGTNLINILKHNKNLFNHTTFILTNYVQILYLLYHY